MAKSVSDEYVYKKEVDWSLFHYDFAIPVEHQVVFSQVADRFLQRGESKDIVLYLNGKSYKARLNNLRMDKNLVLIQILYRFDIRRTVIWHRHFVPAFREVMRILIGLNRCRKKALKNISHFRKNVRSI